ncbi:hypothetical protein [Lacipirellula parvula]|uniref:Uncharacterized protein n=1 Tax=Lacipirellula parvula TaxID=2650471 RepID=A0A5K7XG67_9BACT|nr:hypothetical protein [Lacipirellula parvula]BBO33233.1 hypothetical protein PLANPX_2845 [Lacipirellula parvula]
MPRFNLRNLMIAMTLAAIWGATLVNYRRLIDHPSGWALAICLPLWVYLVAGPFVVAGAAFGNVVTGIKFGLTCAVLLFAFILML